MARTKQTSRKAKLTPEELKRLESEVEIVHGPNARRKPESKNQEEEDKEESQNVSSSGIQDEEEQKALEGKNASSSNSHT